jgi:copper resistance protein D
MDWSGASAPLVATRAIHFAAATIMAGIAVFRLAIARPALRSEAATAKAFRVQTLGFLWGSLGVAVTSGAIWFALESVSMSGLPLDEAMRAETLSTVLNETQFGQVTEIRCVLAIALAVCLLRDRNAAANWAAGVAALGFLASLAWTGHAGSTPGSAGYVHLGADVLHLCAAAAWIGGLVALLLLTTARRHHIAPMLARQVIARFSTLGMVSVATLIVTGLLNAWNLVGSFGGLFETDYGRVLMLKLGLFTAMLAFAGVNRFYVTPRLALSSGNPMRSDALRQLTRNSAIEVALGLAIVAIVGLLGTMHPAVHLSHF